MRRHVLVHESESCNVFLIEWPVGTGLDWHDHGDSWATIQIIEGRLYEEVARDDSWATIEEVARDRFAWNSRHHDAGSFWIMDPDAKHKVVNDGEVTAVSLHTYRPPLTVEYSEDLEIGS